MVLSFLVMACLWFVRQKKPPPNSGGLPKSL
jgi:hypothetical protein